MVDIAQTSLDGVGTVRGLHYQAPPSAQDKLVRCLAGSIMDVAVDVRPNSPTFGKWVAEELSAQNGRQLLVPKGFLHGFATLTPDAQVFYKCSDYYAPEADGAVRFDDPTLGIDWGIDTKTATLSTKDAAAPAKAGLSIDGTSYELGTIALSPITPHPNQGFACETCH